MFESWHRARDIIHTDKTLHNERMSKVVSRYIRLLENMHQIIASSSGKVKTKFRKLEKEYDKLIKRRGAIIQDLIRIERTEDTHFLFEDADFSLDTIKNLIKQGEKDAEEAIILHSEKQMLNNHTNRK
jgi:NTE family protein